MRWVALFFLLICIPHVKRGFYSVMAAQFFSSLADNALLIIAVELLRSMTAPEWQRAALVPAFALFYVVLAPFVGAIADAFPKGKVMFVSNSIKVLGCIAMLFGLHPLLAYAIVGLGAAAYSPAKYGILTELLPPSLLVKANGWIESLTIASILLGTLMGGLLVSDTFREFLANHQVMQNLPFELTFFGIAKTLLVIIYAIAAIINLTIPRTGVPVHAYPKNVLSDFIRCNNLLWKDKLGQITLAVTTLFWGVSGNLRYIVLAWAAMALNYSTSQATYLLGIVAVGTAVGAGIASVRVHLDKASSVIPHGIAMGVLVLAMNFIYSLPPALFFLLILGALGGYLVVPMNALLQHRGHNIMGAGRSIAVQNFNEQASILVLGLAYVGMEKAELGPNFVISSFGILVAVTMVIMAWWYRHNLRTYPKEMQRLLAIAREEDEHTHPHA